MAEQQPKQQNKIDDYLLLNVIATGKASQVWEVMHEQSGQTMAMKLLLPEAMFDNEDKNLLKHEHKVAQLLEHPNCCRSHGLVIRKTECYLLMDLFKTLNLKQFIHADMVAVQSRFQKLVEGVCAGFGHMHDKGWIHMDVKPDNILLNRASEVRLIDFSLAVRKANAISKMLGGSKGLIRGTRTYLAPETIKKQVATPATDIYSLGVVLYECLTGKPPFVGDSPQDLLRKHVGTEAAPPSYMNPNVTAEMDRFIGRMLKKKPKDRFASCSEMLAEFRGIRVFKEQVIEGRQETREEEEKRIFGVSGDSAAMAAEMRNMMTNRRDSRTDAIIQEMIRRRPELQGTYEGLKQEIEDLRIRKAADIARKAEKIAIEREESAVLRQKKRKKKKKSPDQTTSGQPAAPRPQSPPQMMPQHPAMQQPMMQQPMMMPGQPYPGYYPQQMPLGYQPGPGQMPMMPPGYFQTGMQQPGMPPGYPQQQMMPGQQPGMPQQGMPQQPMQPRAGQQPAAQAPHAANPTAQPPAQKAQPKPTSARPVTSRPTPPKPAVIKPDEDIPLMTELPDFE